MASKQPPSTFNELATWLAEDDANSREDRVQRWQELREIMTLPSEEVQCVNGGEGTRICFHEVRRCYLVGSYTAVVLLSLVYVEWELAATLYTSGREDAKKANLKALLQQACRKGLLSEAERQDFQNLGRIRNSHAHFRPPGAPESLMARSVKRDEFPREVLAHDARRALAIMDRLVRRSGKPFFAGG